MYILHLALKKRQQQQRQQHSFVSAVQHSVKEGNGASHSPPRYRLYVVYDELVKSCRPPSSETRRNQRHTAGVLARRQHCSDTAAERHADIGSIVIKKT